MLFQKEKEKRKSISHRRGAPHLSKLMAIQCSLSVPGSTCSHLVLGLEGDTEIAPSLHFYVGSGNFTTGLLLAKQALCKLYHAPTLKTLKFER